MLNLNMMAMTLFLDIGNGSMDQGLDHLYRKHRAANDGMDRSRFNGRNNVTGGSVEDINTPIEEYFNLIISFHEAPCPHALLRFFMHYHPEPGPQMIQLLSRLKSRYCMQLAMICNESLIPDKFRIRSPAINRLIDFYITSSFLTKEIIRCQEIAHESYVSTRLELASFGLCDV